MREGERPLYQISHVGHVVHHQAEKLQAPLVAGSLGQPGKQRDQRSEGSLQIVSQLVHELILLGQELLHLDRTRRNARFQVLVGCRELQL